MVVKDCSVIRLSTFGVQLSNSITPVPYWITPDCVPDPVAESTLRYKSPVRSTKVSVPNLKRTELDKICSSKPCVRSNLSLSAVTVVELLPDPEVSRYLTCIVVGLKAFSVYSTRVTSDDCGNLNSIGAG